MSIKGNLYPPLQNLYNYYLQVSILNFLGRRCSRSGSVLDWLWKKGPLKCTECRKLHTRDHTVFHHDFVFYIVTIQFLKMLCCSITTYYSLRYLVLLDTNHHDVKERKSKEFNLVISEPNVI